MKDLISIIVPVYNLEKELPRCIDSIINQKYTNIEIIIVDDGSSDKSREIIEHYKQLDNRIVPLFKKNSGVTETRLAGVKIAKGYWIGFVDGDDEIESDMYYNLLKNADEYNADISHCGYQMVFDDHVTYFYNTNKVIEQDKIAGVKDLLEGSFIEPGLCNKLFKRELLNQLLKSDVMNLSIRQNEDLLMNYYLFSYSQKSIYQDFCPYHYMVRESSSSKSRLTRELLRDPITVKEIILNDASMDLLISAKSALLQTCVTSMNVLVGEGRKFYRENKKEIRELIVKYDSPDAVVSTKTRFLILLARYCPFLYYPVYKLYLLFQNNRYK